MSSSSWLAAVVGRTEFAPYDPPWLQDICADSREWFVEGADGEPRLVVAVAARHSLGASIGRWVRLFRGTRPGPSTTKVWISETRVGTGWVPVVHASAEGRTFPWQPIPPFDDPNFDAATPVQFRNWMGRALLTPSRLNTNRSVETCIDESEDFDAYLADRLTEATAEPFAYLQLVRQLSREFARGIHAPRRWDPAVFEQPTRLIGLETSDGWLYVLEAFGSAPHGQAVARFDIEPHEAIAVLRDRKLDCFFVPLHDVTERRTEPWQPAIDRINRASGQSSQ